MNALLVVEHSRFEKIAVNSLYCLLALAVFLGQGMFLSNSLFASENPSVSAAYISANVKFKNIESDARGEINILKEKNKWNAMIRQKYKGLAVATVEDGIVHVKFTKYIHSKPIKINVIEINRNINPDIELTPTLASKTLARKATIRTLAQKSNSVVAINGTFFKPTTGVPLGTLMVDGKLITGPIYNRVAMGIGKDDFKMARLKMDASLITKDFRAKIDNINQPRMLSTYVLAYTRDWGQTAPPPPKYGTSITIENNRITKISNGSTKIPYNGYVISGPKEKLEPFFNALSVKVDIKTTPNWEGVDHIISGGPYLVKDNELYVDIKSQRLTAISGKNPRTAIGYTKDNHLILVAVDGREKASVGINIYDLAKFMKALGCYNAMNLDGGGSTVMYVKGNIVNTPAVKGGIALSNALTVSVPAKISYKEEKKVD